MHEAIADIAADRRGNLDARHLGNWIRTHLERRIDGLRIVRYTNPETKSNKSLKWMLAEDKPNSDQTGNNPPRPPNPLPHLKKGGLGG